MVGVCGGLGILGGLRSFYLDLQLLNFFLHLSILSHQPLKFLIGDLLALLLTSFVLQLSQMLCDVLRVYALLL